jgi:thiamine biosynthesis lipoprotein
MRAVEHIMGMPITLDIPDTDDEIIFNKAFDKFRKIDSRFSPYKDDSELSRFLRGEIAQEKLSAEFKKIMAACIEAEKETDGYFSAYFSGKFNPTGYVKGYAIAEAGKVIEKNGFKTYCISAGGDVVARSVSDKIWNIGIQDPDNKLKIIGNISDRNFAVATSGHYERGKHIINPKTGEFADELVSVSVVGPDIIKADILATAIFAGGKSGLDLADEIKDYETLVIDNSDGFSVSSGMVSVLNAGIS